MLSNVSLATTVTSWIGYTSQSSDTQRSKDGKARRGGTRAGCKPNSSTVPGRYML